MVYGVWTCAKAAGSPGSHCTSSSHPSRYYQAPDDLRKKIKATGFLSAKSYGHLWGNTFPARKPSPIVAPVVLGSVCPLVGLHLLTYINVLGKLFSEKGQLWNPEGESPKCSHWVLAFQAILFSSLCLSYSFDISTQPGRCGPRGRKESDMTEQLSIVQNAE